MIRRTALTCAVVLLFASACGNAQLSGGDEAKEKATKKPAAGDDDDDDDASNEGASGGTGSSTKTPGGTDKGGAAGATGSTSAGTTGTASSDTGTADTASGSASDEDSTSGDGGSDTTDSGSEATPLARTVCGDALITLDNKFRLDICEARSPSAFGVEFTCADPGVVAGNPNLSKSKIYAAGLEMSHWDGVSDNRFNSTLKGCKENGKIYGSAVLTRAPAPPTGTDGPTPFSFFAIEFNCKTAGGLVSDAIGVRVASSGRVYAVGEKLKEIATVPAVAAGGVFELAYDFATRTVRVGAGGSLARGETPLAEVAMDPILADFYDAETVSQLTHCARDQSLVGPFFGVSVNRGARIDVRVGQTAPAGHDGL